MTTPNPTPKVVDKVIYVPAPEHAQTLLQGAWRRRRQTSSLVVDGPRGDDGHYRCWMPGDHDYWSAPAERLRVVERASYTPVEAP